MPNHESSWEPHAGEAHVHDHSAPVAGDGGAPAPSKAKNAPAKKAAEAAAKPDS